VITKVTYLQSDDPSNPNKPTQKTRVAVFGSFYRGYHILNNLLNDPELAKRIEIVGVATDDPTKPGVSAKKRVWQYPHTEQEEQMVEELAKKHGIPVYKGKVKTQEFYDLLKNDWKPDIVYMGTFGQLLDEAIINTPKHGIYNMHPSDGVNWPSCVGPNPFEQMFETKKPFCSITLHKANPRFDDGEFTAFSQRIPIPYDDMEHMTLGEKVVHMHQLTSPFAGELANAHLRSEIGMSLAQSQDFYSNKFEKKSAAALPTSYRARLNVEQPSIGGSIGSM
jgi:methionyl-tRNA formyltransferase